MRKIFLFIASLWFIWSSCNQSATRSDSAKSKDLTRTKLAWYRPFFKGVWVRTDYCNEIMKTKSPDKSSKILEEGISDITFCENAISNDSLRMSICFHDHEWSDDTIMLTSSTTGRDIFMLGTPEDYEDSLLNCIGFNVINSDTVLFMYKFDNKSKKLVDSTAYKKVLQTAHAFDYQSGANYFVGKALFSGTYRFLDSSASSGNISLGDTGLVTGFGAFNHFYVLTDFIGPNGTDFLELYKTSDTADEIYPFLWKGDTLFLFNDDPNEYGGAERGALKYALLKIKN